MLGLPGNPSSAFVTAVLFLLPLVRHIAGSNAPFPNIGLAPVTNDIPAGDNRAEYIRARLETGKIKPFSKQDSGMIAPLLEANALLIRPAESPPLKAGDMAPYLAV
jgi:molybdopterin molybdotransferase